MRTLFAVALLVGIALVSGQVDVEIQLNSVDPLLLTFTVSNPFSAPLAFLQWGTPFEGVWTDMFDIRDVNNNRVDYIGMYVRRGETPLDEEYITIPGNGYISTTVNLGDHYEFLSVGKYTVRLDLPLYSELHSETEGQVESLTLASLPLRKPIEQPQGYTNCNSQQISQVQSAISGSRTESARAYNCMTQETCYSLSQTWFGTYSQSNYEFDRSVFYNVNIRLSNYEFNGYCNPPGCGSNVYGYVYPTDSTYTVHMCGLFWSIPAERVNTIVHEMSHFRPLGGTNDYAYGQNNCLNLARTNPNQASRNADNIFYFSESA